MGKKKSQPLGKKPGADLGWARNKHGINTFKTRNKHGIYTFINTFLQCTFSIDILIVFLYLGPM
jgi:hypothetical protein